MDESGGVSRDVLILPLCVQSHISCDRNQLSIAISGTGTVSFGVPAAESIVVSGELVVGQGLLLICNKGLGLHGALTAVGIKGHRVRICGLHRLIAGGLHQPQLGAVIGVGGSQEGAVLGGGDAPQAVVGVVAEAVPGDGVEVHAVVGDQQVKALLTLAGIVVAAEVVDEVVDGLIVHSRVQSLKDLVHRLADLVLQVGNVAVGRGGGAGVHVDARLLLVVGQEGGLAQHTLQGGVDLLLIVLVLLQHLPVLGDGVLARRHFAGEVRQLLVELFGVLGEQGVVQEPLQVGVVLLVQHLQQGGLQQIGPAADVLVVHLGHLAVGDLGEVIGQGGGVVGADVELTVVHPHAPHILVGVVAQARPQVADGAVGEIGVVILAADLLKLLVLIHPVEVDGVVQVVVQQLKVAGGGDLSQVQHGVVVGAQVEVAVVDPHVAGHGVVDTQAEVVAAGAMVADDLGPLKAIVGLLVAPVHGKALLVDLAVDALVGDDGDIQLAVILDDVPDAAAVQAVHLHHGGQAVEVVLLADDTPVLKALGGVVTGHDQAAGVALAVVVVVGQAHEDLAVIHQQAVDAIGDTLGAVNAIIGNAGLVGLGVHLHQGGGGVAHAGEVQLAIKLKGHAVAGQCVETGPTGIAGEDIGRILADGALPEDNLGLAGDLVHGDDHGVPSGDKGFVEGVLAEHHADDLVSQIIGGGAVVTHTLQGSRYVILENIIGGVVASTNIDVVAAISAVCHGPGVDVAPVLVLTGQNAVHLAGTQGGMGNLVDGVPAVRVYALLGGFITNVAVLIFDNSCKCCGGKKSQQHYAA